MLNLNPKLLIKLDIFAVNRDIEDNCQKDEEHSQSTSTDFENSYTEQHHNSISDPYNFLHICHDADQSKNHNEQLELDHETLKTKQHDTTRN